MVDAETPGIDPPLGEHMPVEVGIEWRRDVDAAFELAQHEKQPLLLDFSAAPS